ncbi:hypothetical protein V7149_00450 [Bacillus sp. JJ1503]|uniref:hypothetical protein n=1 Tax=Bacillus sp. JJ1503 TaxID=3122956 RepID=UPI002FFECC86
MTKFNTVKRKAIVGERILITGRDFGEERYQNGDILKVRSLREDGSGAVYVKPNDTCLVLLSEYEVIIENKTEAIGMELQKRGSLLVKAVPTPDYQETIGFTENADGTYSLNFSKMPGLVFVSYDGVGTFDQMFVHGDFKAEAQRIQIDSAVGELTKYTIESTPVIKTEVATLHAGETITPKPKTPQQQRDDIIEQAKRDVAELKVSVSKTNGEPIFKAPNGRGCYADYIVNKENRTVVVLLKGCGTKKLHAKGIAKCAPSDCFNAHIGKAIAVRRALGLEVPAEYLNAPQPTEIRVGDIVTFPKHDSWHRKVNYRVDAMSPTNGEGNLTIVYDARGDEVGTKAFTHFGNDGVDKHPVLDDTRDEVNE